MERPANLESEQDLEVNTANTADTTLFRRNYQACLNCRRHKVKCNLGNVDNPSAPPCVRCRRESKDCSFSQSKRGGSRPIEIGRAKRRALLEQRNLTVIPSCASSGRPDALPLEPRNLAYASSYIAQKPLSNMASDPLAILGAVANMMSNDETINEGSCIETKKRGKIGKLENQQFVECGIVTGQGAKQYIDHFYQKMFPFFPFVPKEYATNHEALVDQDPILCCTIIAIASRYHKLDHVVGGTQHDNTHDRCWKFLKECLQRALWSSNSTRTLGCIESFLLLAHWSPKAIHWNDDDEVETSDNVSPSAILAEDVKSTLVPARKSERMSWMMIGTAIRLAQDMNFHTGSRSETCVDNERKSRIWAACYLSDRNLSIRLKRKPLITSYVLFSGRDNRTYYGGSLAEEARLNIVHLFWTAHEIIYTSQETTDSIVANKRHFPLFDWLDPLLADVLKKIGQCASFEKTLLLIEHHHLLIYIKSLSLHAATQRRRTQSSHMCLTPDVVAGDDGKAIFEAVEASKELLRIVVNDLGSHGWMCNAPVRLFLQVIYSSVFLIKALHVGAFPGSWNEVTVLLDSVVHMLRGAAPDALHLSLRYASLLDTLTKQIHPVGSESLNRPSMSTGGQNYALGASSAHSTRPVADFLLQASAGEASSEPFGSETNDSLFGDYCANSAMAFDFLDDIFGTDTTIWSH